MHSRILLPSPSLKKTREPLSLFSTSPSSLNDLPYYLSICRTFLMSSSTPTSTAFKLLLLATLALQNSGITLVTRYSRGVLREHYSVISIVVTSELIKLLLSIVMACRPMGFAVQPSLERLVLIVRSSLVMSVPGLIYLVQNQLTYVGLANLESASYSMLNQLKLLTTAFFAVLILRKKLWAYQWRALLLLFIGVVLVQAQAAAMAQSGSKVQTGDVWMGTLAVIGVATLSGLAGIYFEYVLKGNTAFNMWDRNVQLSLWSIGFGLLSIPFSPNELAFYRTFSFFHGFSSVSVAVVVLSSAGGLLVSACVAYTDNILKNFATSLAILLTSAISAYAFQDLTLDAFFACGTGCVLLAVFNYSEDVKALGRSVGMLEVGDTVEGWGVVRIVKKEEDSADDASVDEGVGLLRTDKQSLLEQGSGRARDVSPGVGLQPNSARQDSMERARDV